MQHMEMVPLKKQMGRTFPLMKGGKLDFIYQYGNVWVKSHVFHPLHGVEVKLLRVAPFTFLTRVR